MKDIGSRLKELRGKSGQTQEDIASILRGMGVKADRSILARWENDIQKPTLPKLKALAQIYNTTTDYILDGFISTYKINAKTIPIFDDIGPNTLIYVENNADNSLVISGSWDVDFALRVKDNSMIGANIPEGSIALCKRQNEVINTHVAVCSLNGEEAILRTVITCKGVTAIYAGNQNYPPTILTGKDKDNLKIIGVCKSVIYHMPLIEHQSCK